MEEKLTFWKKLKMSITNFEGYQDLAAEKLGKTILYIFILILIFSMVLAGAIAYKFVDTIENGKIKQYIEENIETIEVKDGKLKITSKNETDEINIIEENTNLRIIINTSEDKKIQQQKIEEMKSYPSGLLILEDRMLIKNELSTEPREYIYQEEFEQLGMQDFIIDKQTIIDSLSINNMMPILIPGYIFSVIVILIFNFPTMLIDILVFSAMGYIFTHISRIRIRYSAVYNIASYATTLPILLSLLYTIIRFFTGFTIKYFDIMYTAVTSIYIITAILIIKSEVIKKQIELAKIVQEQERVKEELRRKEEEEKQEKEKEEQRKKEEKERNEKKDEKDQKDENGGKDEGKKKKGSKPDINIGDEPEGNNV